jgi:prepilin-type processing-associated H-X9-DG protein
VFGIASGRDAPLIAFSSHHSSGVQFCFADGSVRMLRFGETALHPGPLPRGEGVTADWQVLQELAGWRDGAAAQKAALVLE